MGGLRELRVEGISKTYGGRTVLRDVTLALKGGEVVGLLGPNGAGKTTTFAIVAGLVRPDRGRVILNGEDLTGLPIYQRARRGISYLPQEPSVFRKLTVEQNLLAILETLPLSPAERKARLGELLAELNLTHLARQRADSLSGGERRRVEITRALVLDPQFMLLDEPFSGIDPLSVVDIQEIVLQLRSKGIGVLVTDHNVRETLGICERAYILSEGSLLEEGTPRDILASARARQVYLGEQFRL